MRRERPQFDIRVERTRGKRIKYHSRDATTLMPRRRGVMARNARITFVRRHCEIAEIRNAQGGNVPRPHRDQARLLRQHQ